MLNQFAASPWRQMTRDSILAVAMTICAGFATAEYLAVSVAPARPLGSADGATANKGGDSAGPGTVNKLQAAIDASPRIGAGPQTAELKAVLPLPRPKLAQDRAEHAAPSAPANVARFDTCLPQCESQDRLLVSAVADRGEAYPPIPMEGEDVALAPAPPGGFPRLLSRVIDAPGVALRRGRSFASHIHW